MKDNYFIRNLETGKLELHFDKATYQELPQELKNKIKNYFLWSRNASAWVSKGKFGGYCDIIAQELGLADKGKTGERLAFAEQMERKVERAENRAEKMEEKADKALGKCEQLQSEHKRNCQDHAYVFQPGMGGTFDRYRERVFNRYAKGFEEYRKSQHYSNQAATASRTASQEKLRNPAFLDRRIKENEKEIREIERRIKTTTTPEYIQEYGEKHDLNAYWDMLGRHYEEAMDKLNFYRAKMDEIGGAVFSKDNIKVGSIVKIRGSWCKVDRANPTTVSITIIAGGAAGFKLKYPYAEIKEVKTN